MSAVTRRRPSTPSAATARPGRPATRPCGYAAILHFVDERGHRWAVLTNSPTRPGAAAISAVPSHVGQASCTSVDLPVGTVAWPGCAQSSGGPNGSVFLFVVGVAPVAWTIRSWGSDGEESFDNQAGAGVDRPDSPAGGAAGRAGRGDGRWPKDRRRGQGRQGQGRSGGPGRRVGGAAGAGRGRGRRAVGRP